MKALIGLFFLAKLIPVVQLAFFLNVVASLIASSLLGSSSNLLRLIRAKIADNEPRPIVIVMIAVTLKRSVLFFNDLIAPFESAAWQH